MGECECIKVDPEEESGYRHVRMLGESDHFGEVAILKNIKRTLSVRAVSNLKLLVLTRETFTRILGSIKDYLKEDYQNLGISSDTSFDSAKNSDDQGRI